MVLSIEERLQVFNLSRENSARRAAQIFNDNNPNRPPISHSTVVNLVSKFNATGSLANLPKRGRRSKRKDEEIIFDVLAQVVENPHISSRRIAQEAGISQSTALKVLHDNKFRPYKASKLHFLETADAPLRLAFAGDMLTKINGDENYLPRVLFSDESLFTLRHSFNTQNKRKWADENPHYFINSNARAAVGEKVMVWAGILNDNIIGPFFFEENVSGESYYAMLIGDVIPELLQRGLDPKQVIFQQDGAAPHYTNFVRAFLTATFESWIGRGSPTLKWPARSPDFNPLDYFCWSYVKHEVYSTQPANMPELREKIRTAFETITPEMLVAVQTNFVRRMQLAVEHHGEIIERYM